MKHRALIVPALLASLLAVAAPCAQAFGLGDLANAATGSSSGSKISAGDVDTFIRTAHEADLMINTAASHIYKMVANKEEVAKYEAALQAANTVSDPKEKEAKINQIKADRDTDLKKMLASKETEAKVKGMNAEQLKNFGNAAYTFMLGILKDKQLAEGSTALVSGAGSNPSLLPKLASLKDAASSVASQVKSAASMGEGLVKLAKVGNINIMPASTSEKPKIANDI